MDIIELAILFAFVLLPLLQAVLEKIGGARRPPVGREEAEDTRDTSEPDGGQPVATKEVSSEQASQGTAEVDAGWSAGWGRWPSEPLEELAAEEIVTRAEAEEIIERQERLEDDLTSSEAALVTVPVVSMEPLYVDHTRREPRRTGTRPVVRPPSPIGGRREAGRVLPGLRSRSEVRRAIVLAEVLGPPLALERLERMPFD